MNKIANWILTPVVVGLLGLVPACGGEDGAEGDDHEELSPAADACEHMQEGPSQTVTATADAAADAPDIGESHTRFDITLADDGSGMNVGHLDLVMAEEGGVIVFVNNADVDMMLLDSSGSAVTEEEVLSNITECTEVSAGHTFDLGVGTYTLMFGPTAESTVQVVLVPEGEHGHEEE